MWDIWVCVVLGREITQTAAVNFIQASQAMARVGTTAEILWFEDMFRTPVAERTAELL